jgi:hypothetical protein
MEYKYSDKLIKEFQDYMKERYNLDLDKEVCDEYLDSMVDLYMTFIK